MVANYKKIASEYMCGILDARNAAWRGVSSAAIGQILIALLRKFSRESFLNQIRLGLSCAYVKHS